MFDPSDTPRIFGLAPGVDFPKALVEGLMHRFEGHPPQDLARVELIVNTQRMARRLREVFEAGPPMLLPRIRVLTDLAGLAPTVVQPPATPPLRRRLELVRLISALLEQDSGLAPKTSVYDLADSLAKLMDEMQGEGVLAEDIARLDVSLQSDHWANAQKFIGIVQTYLAQTEATPDKEARQRAMVQGIAAEWAVRPPDAPVILAGSTGSRGTTLLLMKAIAKLPQGAVVMPGFDFEMPAHVWREMADPMVSEDHPQYRFFRVLETLERRASAVKPWHGTAPFSPARNKLVSLALRPAPVTDAWRVEGPNLPDLQGASQDLTLLQADSPRMEALTIAMRLRQAAEDGQTAALITPDRMLSRRVTSALSRWNIYPDDSAGIPLQLTPVGRFLRHVAALFRQKLDAELLLTLLKHPLTHSGEGRNTHLLKTRQVELEIRDKGLPYPDRDGFIARAMRTVTSKEQPEDVQIWAEWVSSTIIGQHQTQPLPLADWVALHLKTANAIAAGVSGTGTHRLWSRDAGREAAKVMAHLSEEAAYGDLFTSNDYADLIGTVLAGEDVRAPDGAHPGIMIWGTLEARVQGADLVILGGLNEGTWPEMPNPDPWLNRQMRHEAGLLLPERNIGLSAHDFQQAIAAPEVWITRAIRSEDAETVPSRWLNRLGNLLNGLKEDGKAAYDGMVARGDHWRAKAALLENHETVQPAIRPSPRPPRSARPKQLSVTEIKTLIRDPYAIFAKHGLRLRKLQPLVQSPDALLRGTAMHKIMEQFVRQSVGHVQNISESALLETAKAVLDTDIPWPAARAMWMGRIQRIASRFVEAERLRQSDARPIAFEKEASAVHDFHRLGVTLKGIADRIDQREDGQILIYDYKTGKPPTKPQQENFDKQLLIEAAMMEAGDFIDRPAARVAAATFLGLNTDLNVVPAPIHAEPLTDVMQKLEALIAAYLDPNKGFTSRRMMERDGFAGDYDHIARFGEWDVSDPAQPEDLT